jgi:hypothetical protein
MAMKLAASVLLALAAAAIAAPVGKEAPGGGFYFPTTVGTKWVYQINDKTETVEVITAAEEKDKATRVTVGRERRGEVFTDRVIDVSDKGLAAVAFNLGDLTEPLWLLRLPHAAGNKWEPVMAGKVWGRAIGTAKASGPERIEVPSGAYQAIRVDMEMPYIDGHEGTDKRSYWYAPGVGLVKQVADGKVKVLKSFTLGKK